MPDDEAMISMLDDDVPLLDEDATITAPDEYIPRNVASAAIGLRPKVTWDLTEPVGFRDKE